MTTATMKTTTCAGGCGRPVPNVAMRCPSCASRAVLVKAARR